MSTPGCSPQLLTCGDQLAGTQEADGEPHDGGLVQVGADAVGQRQLVGQLVEDLRLFAAPASRRVPRLLLAALRAAPATNTQGNGSWLEPSFG